MLGASEFSPYVVAHVKVSEMREAKSVLALRVKSGRCAALLEAIIRRASFATYSGWLVSTTEAILRSVRSAAFIKNFSGSPENLQDNPVGSRARGLELDLRLREFEINQLTQRNNFFMIFQGVLVAGLVQSHGTAAPIITFCMSALGFVTSMLQVGMAGGAKYWQSRWEASTRSSEIAIVLELLKLNKFAVQTFTHDSSLLSDAEQKQIRDWNSTHPEADEALTDDSDYIRSVVLKDIQGGPRKPVRRALDWWVRTFAIAPKWSVSRIPIWIAAALLLFWLVILAHTVHIPGLELGRYVPAFVELVPLQRG